MLMFRFSVKNMLSCLVAGLCQTCCGNLQSSPRPAGLRVGPRKGEGWCRVETGEEGEGVKIGK